MKYKVIVCDAAKGIDHFEKTVSEFLNAGYKLAGGISICYETASFIQSVYCEYDEEELEKLNRIKELNQQMKL